MSFMDPVVRVCEACNGKKYNDEALSYTYHGKTIAQVLQMTVSEGMEFFKDTPIRRKLRPLAEVGLSYLTLGQTTATLSGGECQRLKLAARLHEKNQFYIMDEPSAGLHGQDVAVLLGLLNQLVDNGNTVLAVEHNFDIISQADWIIDMGPDGGTTGGHVVYQGRLQGLLQCPSSYTAAYLAKKCNKGKHGR
jgi:excinuclease UvrABC ATPase subunit